ncbi:MAG: GNAT family N-acetyltransferase [Chloroflexota bacterium]
MSDGTLPDLHFRHLTEDDHRPIAALAREWWEDRAVRHATGRAWFRHFGSTSWAAVTPDGTIAGFLIGFPSVDRPGVAVVHLVGTRPNARRRGIGRALVQRFVDDLASRGVVQVESIVWPGHPGTMAFHRALGFVADDGAGTMRLYGTPAFPEYDGDGEDRARLVRDLRPPVVPEASR